MTPYERVRKSRELTAATFPLPSVLDCVRYAITELAEYDDALLRRERTGDKRNNDKAHDARTELGQCGYMIVSAIMQVPAQYCLDTPTDVERDGKLRTTYYFATLADLGDAGVNFVFEHCTAEATTDLQWAWFDFVRLCDWHNWDVDALIDDTCAAFEAKHAPREVQP